MNKKGIEPVISTVLLIVITIAVVGVLVAFLLPWLRLMTDRETACNSLRVEINDVGSCTNDTSTKVMVSFSSGNFNLSKITVQVTSGERTVAPSFTNPIPLLGGAETYTVNTGNASKVGAIPWVKYNNHEFDCQGGKAELLPVQRCP